MTGILSNESINGNNYNTFNNNSSNVNINNYLNSSIDNNDLKN